eukprot:ctg_698.g336
MGEDVFGRGRHHGGVAGSARHLASVKIALFLTIFVAFQFISRSGQAARSRDCAWRFRRPRHVPVAGCSGCLARRGYCAAPRVERLARSSERASACVAERAVGAGARCHGERTTRRNGWRRGGRSVRSPGTGADAGGRAWTGWTRSARALSSGITGVAGLERGELGTRRRDTGTGDGSRVSELFDALRGVCVCSVTRHSHGAWWCPTTDEAMGEVPQYRFAQAFGERTTGEPPQEADLISAVEFSRTGDFVATGDKGGRVVILQRVDAGRGWALRREQVARAQRRQVYARRAGVRRSGSGSSAAASARSDDGRASSVPTNVPRSPRIAVSRARWTNGHDVEASDGRRLWRDRPPHNHALGDAAEISEMEDDERDESLSSASELDRDERAPDVSNGDLELTEGDVMMSTYGGGGGIAAARQDRHTPPPLRLPLDGVRERAHDGRNGLGDGNRDDERILSSVARARVRLPQVAGDRGEDQPGAVVSRRVRRTPTADHQRQDHQAVAGVRETGAGQQLVRHRCRHRRVRQHLQPSPRLRASSRYASERAAADVAAEQRLGIGRLTGRHRVAPAQTAARRFGDYRRAQARVRQRPRLPHQLHLAQQRRGDVPLGRRLAHQPVATGHLHRGFQRGGHQTGQHGGADRGDHRGRVPPPALQPVCVQQQQGHSEAVRPAHQRAVRLRLSRVLPVRRGWRRRARLFQRDHRLHQRLGVCALRAVRAGARLHVAAGLGPGDEPTAVADGAGARVATAAAVRVVRK